MWNLVRSLLIKAISVAGRFQVQRAKQVEAVHHCRARHPRYMEAFLRTRGWLRHRKCRTRLG